MIQSALCLSIDGIGAYDHILRSAFLTKLHNVPALQGILPFVRSIYARNSSCVWEDSYGVRHRIVQTEGGEQGDPLMPLLFSLGIHDSLRAVKEDETRRRVVCVSGRRARRFTSRQNQRSAQPRGSRTSCWGRDPVEHWQDTHVESWWNTATRSRPFGRRCVGP